MHCCNEKSMLLDIINKQDVRTCFQPIVDIKNAKIIGYEALSRGPKGSSLERPDILFEIAKKCNMLWEIELLCRKLAIERACNLGLNKYLFLNVDPRVIKDEKFKEGFTSSIAKLSNMDPCKIIFEITEKTAVEDYKAFKEALDHYVKQGYKIAIDDTGAGYSGIRLITETKPQFIKLDMALIRDIDKDSFKQAMCKNLIYLGKITNMKLIAEGVENINELNTLINIGVEYVQGYFLGKPLESLQDIPEDVKNYISLLILERSKEIFYTSKIFPTGKICRMDKGLELNLKGADLKSIFINSIVQGVAITKGDTPVGLIMKNKFNERLAAPYGNAIFLNRSIELMMDKNPLIVDYEMPIAEVSKLAMSRSEENLYDYIIVTRNEKYFGIVTVKSLLESTTEVAITMCKD